MLERLGEPLGVVARSTARARHRRVHRRGGPRRDGADGHAARCAAGRRRVGARGRGHRHGRAARRGGRGAQRDQAEGDHDARRPRSGRRRAPRRDRAAARGGGEHRRPPRRATGVDRGDRHGGRRARREYLGGLWGVDVRLPSGAATTPRAGAAVPPRCCSCAAAAASATTPPSRSRRPTSRRPSTRSSSSSMPYDVLIRAADRDIAIADGVIAGFEAGPAREEIDAQDLTVLPGVIDACASSRPAAPTGKAGRPGTAALAAGGARCVEMPLNAHPADDRRPRVRRQGRRRARVRGRGFRALGRARPRQPRPPRGAGRARRRRLQGVHVRQRDRRLPGRRRGRARRRHGAGRRAWPAVAVHAEDPASLREPAGTGWRDFVASRPVEAELRAIETAIELARETGCSLHVVHVSTARGVDLMAQSDATCETCPHYLTLTEDDLETLGTRAKCAPPLRTAAERDALRGGSAASRSSPPTTRRARRFMSAGTSRPPGAASPAARRCCRSCSTRGRGCRRG